MDENRRELEVIYCPKEGQSSELHEFRELYTEQAGTRVIARFPFVFVDGFESDPKALAFIGVFSYLESDRDMLLRLISLSRGDPRRGDGRHVVGSGELCLDSESPNWLTLKIVTGDASRVLAVARELGRTYRGGVRVEWTFDPEL